MNLLSRARAAIARVWASVFGRKEPPLRLPAKRGDAYVPQPSITDLEGMPEGFLNAGLAPHLVTASSKQALQGAAPWPVVDKYPIVQGQALSLQTLASAYRVALTGYRLNYVDILDELLERDPHAFAVLSQRILVVAGGRLEFKPAVGKDDPRFERAEEITKLVDDQVKAIPSLRQHFATLLWSLFYGIVGAEIHWDRVGNAWTIKKLSFVHSRRFSFPDPNSWDLYIVDQGGPFFPAAYAGPNATYGLRIDDYPNKFITHAPQVRGDYPTRDGLGRELGDWLCLKRLGARGAAQYLERFAKPWALGSYKTGYVDETGSAVEVRSATKEDIQSLEAAMNALGVGSLSSYTHPDSVDVDMKTPDGVGGSKIGYLEFLGYCDDQITKAVRGNTFTTSAGKFGAKGTAETGRDGELDLARYDAACFADTLKRDLVTAIVRLNAPGDLDLVPHVCIHVEDDPEPKAIMDLALTAVKIGMPLDADALAARVDLKLIPQDDEDDGDNLTADGEKKSRRCALVLPVAISSVDTTIEPPPMPAPLGAIKNPPDAEEGDEAEQVEPPAAH